MTSLDRQISNLPLEGGKIAAANDDIAAQGTYRRDPIDERQRMPTRNDIGHISPTRQRRPVKRYVVIGVLAVAIVSAFAVTSSAGSRQSSGRTLTLIEQDESSAFADTGAKSPNRRNPRFSGGDLHVFTSAVFNHANVRIGRLYAHCVAVRGGRSFVRALFQCTGTFVLRDGTIVVNAAFRGNQDDEDVRLAVTGGTGSYEGARGSVTVRRLPRERIENTVHLLA